MGQQVFQYRTGNCNNEHDLVIKLVYQYFSIGQQSKTSKDKTHKLAYSLHRAKQITKNGLQFIIDFFISCLTLYIEMDIIFMDSENRKTNTAVKMLSNCIDKWQVKLNTGYCVGLEWQGHKEVYQEIARIRFFFQSYSLSYEIKRKTIIFISFLRRVIL